MEQLLKANIDTQKSSFSSIGSINAGDDLILELTLSMQGVALEFENPTFELLSKKSDNTQLRQNINITVNTDKSIKIYCDRQISTCQGIVSNQLIIKDNGRVSTCLFYFTVGRSLDNEILQSISNVQVLEELDRYVVTAFNNLKEFEERINTEETLLTNLDKKLADNEQVRQEAEEVRNDNFNKLIKEINNKEHALTELTKTVESNENNRINAEADRSNKFNALKGNMETCIDAAIDTNNLIKENEESRKAAETLRANTFNTLKGNMESATSNSINKEAERNTNFNKLKSSMESATNTSIKEESNRSTKFETLSNEIKSLKSNIETLNTTMGKNEENRVLAEEKRTEKFSEILSDNNSFKEDINTSFGNAKVGYDGIVHKNVVERLNIDFDNMQQQINQASYLEYTGTNIKADSTYYGLTKDLNIKGNTIHNLITSDKDALIETPKEGSTNRQNVHKPLSYNLKANTVYTRIFNIKELSQAVDMYDSINGLDGTYTQYPYKIQSTGICVSKFTISEKGGVNQYIVNPSNALSQVVGFKMVIGEMLLLEGDYTNTPISELPFKEGIYSVGEDEKIKVKSVGKNLFDMSKLKSNNSSGITSTYDAENNAIRLKGTANTTFGGFSTSNKLNVGTYRVTIFTNGAYSNQRNKLWCYDKDGGLVVSPNNGVVFTVDREIERISIVLQGISTGAIVDEYVTVQIEEGTEMTDYSSYIDHELTYQLDEPLRKLPNGVCDEIVGNQLIRRVGEIIINGVGIYASAIANAGEVRWVLAKNSTIKNVVSIKPSVLCERHPSISSSDSWGGALGVSQNNLDNAIHLRHPKYKSGTTEEREALRNELQTNPLAINYELAEPIVTELEQYATLKTYNGTTHIISENTLPATIAAKVPSNVQAIMMDLKAENENLTNELKNTNENLAVMAMEQGDYLFDNDLRITMLELGLA